MKAALHRSGFRAAPALLALLFAATAGAAPEGVPALDDFARLPAIRSPELSPDGRRLAFLDGSGGRFAAVWMDLDDPDGIRHKVHRRGTRDSVRVAWSGNRHLIVASIERTGLMQREIARSHVLDLASGRLRAIAPEPSPGGHSLRARRAAARFTASVELVDALRHRPGLAVFRVGDPRAGASEVRLIELDTGRSLADEEIDRTMRTVAVDRSGRLRLAVSGRDDRADILYRAPDARDWRSLVPPLRPDAGDEPIGLGADGETLLVLRPVGAKGSVLLPFRPEDGGFGAPLLSAPGHAVTAILREDGPAGRVIGYRHATDFEEDVYIDAAHAAYRKTVDRLLPGSINRIESASDDGRRLLAVAERADAPPAWYLVDTVETLARPLGSAMPGLAGQRLAAARPVVYPARDGTEIPAYLTRPLDAREGPLPAVLLVHGGPHARVWQGYDDWRQFLASRGHLVLEPNFRGSSGYGRAWQDAGRLEWGGLMQDDLDDAARWLVAQGLAEPSRLCIMGGSYGGYAALLGAATMPELYRCAISINGVADLEALERADRGTWGGAPWARFIGEGEATPEGRARVSPLMAAGEIDVPVLLIHAVDDLRVDIGQSRAMAAAIERAGGPVELVELPSGGHPLASEESRRMTLRAIERFLSGIATGEAS